MCLTAYFLINIMLSIFTDSFISLFAKFYSLFYLLSMSQPFMINYYFLMTYIKWLIFFFYAIL